MTHQPPTVRLDSAGDIAVMVIDNPPVNALSPAVALQMREVLDAFERCAGYRALLVHCVGRTFVAGGDIASFDDPDFSATPLNRTLARMEALDRPVVAALHGFVLGGGLELAMACHWRVAMPGTHLGLPEIKLGLIPGSLGTQRLPRLVGMAKAYDMISSGESLQAPAALGCGLVDHVAEADADIHGAALAYTRRLLEGGAGARATCGRPIDMAGVPDGFFARERRLAYADRARFPAGVALVDALDAATASFGAGETVEARAFEMLRRSPESKALRYLFFAQRQAARSGPDRWPLHGERTHQAFLQAIARLVHDDGVSPTRLARALRGFGFSTLPPGLAADDGAVLHLDEPQLLPPLLDVVVDEAARLLEEGLCARGSDIDVAWTHKHGYPRFRGGPVFHAEASGLAGVVDRLVARGLQPCRLLCELGRTGGRLSAYSAARSPHLQAQP